MKFKTTGAYCTVCGKLRRFGYHDPCSKQLQAERAAMPPPKRRPAATPTPRQLDDLTNYIKRCTA